MNPELINAQNQVKELTELAKTNSKVYAPELAIWQQKLSQYQEHAVANSPEASALFKSNPSAYMQKYGSPTDVAKLPATLVSPQTGGATGFPITSSQGMSPTQLTQAIQKTGTFGDKGQYTYNLDAQGNPTGAPIANTPPPITNPPSTVGSSDAERARIRTEEIAKQKAELEKGTQQPSLYKSVDEFKKLRQEKGVVEDENELASIQKEARTAKEQLNQFKQTSNKEISQGGYLGGISEAERNMNFRMNDLALREQAVISRLNNKNSYINTVVNLGKEDYQTAYTNYTNEYNKNVKATELYNAELDDQQKDALTGITTTFNLLKDSNITELTPQLQTQLNTYENQLGLQQGSLSTLFEGVGEQNAIQNIQKDSDGNVWTVVKDKKTGQIGVKVLAKLPGGGGDGELNKLLTPEESAKLGVPYGTTRGQASGLIVKKPLGNTQITDLTQAQLAKRNVERIDELVQELGSQGPILGRFRQLNPYDTRVVELNNLITQTVPGLARGIFKEVGVLTDTDINRYTQTLANTKLTKEQADIATKQLLKTINYSINTQLQTLNKAGKDVREFDDLLESTKGDSAKVLQPTEIPDGYYQASDGLLYKK